MSAEHRISRSPIAPERHKFTICTLLRLTVCAGRRNNSHGAAADDDA